MDTTVKKQRKITIRDVLDECELSSLGISHSVDGSVVSPSDKISEFLYDNGYLDDPVYKGIQEKFHGKLRDKGEREKYRLEISLFTKEYLQKHADEYFEKTSVNK